MMPGHSIRITVLAHEAADCLPDADLDVLIWAADTDESQLGAYLGHDDTGPMWVDAQGQRVAGVTHWADMPGSIAATTDAQPGQRTSTATLAQAMRTLAAEITSDDGVANMACLEAAERLDELGGGT